MSFVGSNNKKVDSWRVFLFFGIMIAVVLFYVYRLFSMQVLEGDNYLAAAEGNRVKELSVQTQRGIIYDRNGFVLARNVAAYNIVITPALLPEDEGSTQKIYRELSKIIGLPVNQGDIEDEETVRNFTPCFNDLGIAEIVYMGTTNAPFRPIQVSCDVDPEIAMIVREKVSVWPGVDIEVEPVREYPTGQLTSEIIGFLGPISAVEADYYEELGFVTERDKVGYSGIEASMNEELMGLSGKRTVEVDGAGQVIRDLELPIAPVPGTNIRLTIDTRLQSAAKTALINEMEFWNRRLPEPQFNNGAVIAMDPRTGEILALVSYPTFENNRMARVIPGYYYNQLQEDPQKPLLNHAISAEHPPGSVYKMAAAIGALNEGVVPTDKKLFDPGKITIVQKFTPNDPGVPIDFVCYTYKDTGAGHGDVNFFEGVALSCDVYFYKIGGGYLDEVPDGGLGVLRLAEYAKALGYGSETGIELFGEGDGIVPTPAWKRRNVGENWSTGDTYIATIGQGYVLATPIQVLLSFATIANDGKQMKPTLIYEQLDNEGNVVVPFSPTMTKDITQDKVIQIFDEDGLPTGEYKSVDPWAIEMAQEGMRLAVLDGTATNVMDGFTISNAGKTGTAEYCDNVAQEKGICERGAWPSHAWYAGYAPYEDPEIVVVTFVYNGKEGATLAAPVVRKVMESYFELKAIDAGLETAP